MPATASSSTGPRLLAISVRRSRTRCAAPHGQLCSVEADAAVRCLLPAHQCETTSHKHCLTRSALPPLPNLVPLRIFVQISIPTVGDRAEVFVNQATSLGVVYRPSVAPLSATGAQLQGTTLDILVEVRSAAYLMRSFVALVS